MASTSRAKASGVSSSSFFDLKAELAKKEDEFSKAKAAGKGRAVAGRIKRPGKKPTVWARQNKGVASRSARDIELEAVSKPTLEAARAALERKARIYDKLRRGKTGGLSERQFDDLLVDFDQKGIENDDDSDSESNNDDVDESLTVPGAPDYDDSVVEYEDEFGRVRTGKRSEIPRELLRQKEDDYNPDDDPYLIRGDVNYFPVYEPTAERVAEIREEARETDPTVHYDATRDLRDKGAGFYRFSGDEEARRRQMEELKQARLETEQAREQAGVANPVEKVVEERETGIAGRGIEKRKREIEERRKALEAKRRKKEGSSAEDKKSKTTTENADDFLANLEKEMLQGKGS